MCLTTLAQPMTMGILDYVKMRFLSLEGLRGFTCTQQRAKHIAEAKHGLQWSLWLSQV